MNTEKHSNLNEIENQVREIFDPVVIANEEESDYGSEEMYRQYIDNILCFYIQELVTQDIRSAGLSEDEEMALLDHIGNIDFRLWDDKLYDFYRNRCQFDSFLEDLRS